jgi:LysM repeat protein
MEQRISIQFYIKRKSFIKKGAKRMLEILIVLASIFCIVSAILFLVHEIQEIHFTKKSIPLITQPKVLKMIDSLHDTILLQSLPTIINQSIDTSKSKVESSMQSVSSIHIVKGNETLYRISVKNKVSVESLRSINNLANNTIKVGMRLKIPQKE